MKTLLELMMLALVIGLIISAITVAVAAVLLWLGLAAAYDRIVGRGCGVGYWRWLGDRWHRMSASSSEARELPVAVRERTVLKLQHQTALLARRIEQDRRQDSAIARWGARQQEPRLQQLKAQLAAERESLYGPILAPEPHHRAADADRENAIATLEAAYADGRLDATEFEERAGRAYAARTYADLVGLDGDLRSEGGAPPQKRRVSHAERERTVAALRVAAGEGRLSPLEFGERAEHAYGAKTAGDLARVVEDLPDSYALRRALS